MYYNILKLMSVFILPTVFKGWLHSELKSDVKDYNNTSTKRIICKLFVFWLLQSYSKFGTSFIIIFQISTKINLEITKFGPNSHLYYLKTTVLTKIKITLYETYFFSSFSCTTSH